MAETVRFQTKDASRVEETWQRFVPSAKLQRVDPAQFDFSWISTGTESMSVVGYELAAVVDSEIEPLDQFIACRVQTRQGWVSARGSGVHAGQPWASVGRPVRAHWEDRARVRALIFDAAYVQHSARTITGDDRFLLPTATTVPRTLALAQQWECMHAYVTHSLAALDDDSVLLAAGIREHALRTTLSVFTSGVIGPTERSPQTRPAPATVRRAIAFMDAHLAEPVSLDQIAAAAGVSTRGLQAAFRRALDTTPTAYLRTARLSQAHRDLESTADTVAEVSRRWGFSSPSRFAVAYREAYGRNPRR